MAVAATAVEAIALAVSAVGLTVYQASGHRPQSVADSWGVVAMAVVGAVFLGFVVRALVRRRRWARSPAVLTQLIGLPIGIGVSGDGGAAGRRPARGVRSGRVGRRCSRRRHRGRSTAT